MATDVSRRQFARLAAVHKQEFVAKNQQVIWRFHDHWHDREPDPVSKGMIVLGHAISEDPGMDECAKWLKTFLPEMPIEFIPAGEPFWNPMGI